MRCYSCGKVTLSIFCHTCLSTLLVPTLSKRNIGTLAVFSFFKYSHIEAFLLLKHKPEGHRIYKCLAKHTMKPFIEAFAKGLEDKVYIIGIDEYVKEGYSHTAVLSQTLKTAYTEPIFTKLMARNRVKYAGKSLDFRLANARDFVYSGKKDIDVILIDDIITTGITLQEAQSVLLRSGVNVLFALTLADVEE